MFTGPVIIKFILAFVRMVLIHFIVETDDLAAQRWKRIPKAHEGEAHCFSPIDP